MQGARVSLFFINRHESLTESQGWKGPAFQPPAKAGPPRAGYAGMHPGGFGMSPQPRWAVSSSALPPSMERCSSSC